MTRDGGLANAKFACHSRQAAALGDADEAPHPLQRDI
jgi:hypothetical protein